MKVKFKIVTEGAVPPSRHSKSAAGVDLFVPLDAQYTIEPHRTVKIGIGIAAEIPEGYVGLIFARSGTATKQGLAPANKVGVIDSDYRGELIVALHNHSEQEQTVSGCDRIAQLVIVPCLLCDFVEVNELSKTERGAGGFGSTGK